MIFRMGKYLNVGNAGFASIRKSNYVDKTRMISFVNGTLGTSDKLQAAPVWKVICGENAVCLL